MSYTAEVIVSVMDADGNPVTATEIQVEFGAPDDPRDSLTHAALARSAENVRLAAAHGLWP